MSETPIPTISTLDFVYQLTGQDPALCTVHNRSMIAWDETRGKRKWPSSTEAPFLWQTFIVFHHLSRSGVYAGTWEQFREECEAVESIGEDDVDPTQSAAEPEWSSSSD